MKVEKIRGKIPAVTIVVCSLWIGVFSFTLDAVADEATMYELTVTVISGPGTVEPNSGSYSAGTVVTLTATPEAGYLLKQWTGTDDDTSCALTNTVTMDSDKTVAVEFGPPRVIGVGSEPNLVSIQYAIDAAGCGDTVIVPAGVYFEDINFNGKNIRVTSMNPDDPNIVALTVIQGTGTGPVVTFSGSESQSCMLDGITITGGNTTGNGGGICGNGTEATIANCVITNNHADGAGGGLSDCRGTILGCTITGNTANSGGGGIYVEDCNVSVEDCDIKYNAADDGGGMYNIDSNTVLTGCTFSDNTAGYGGGMFNRGSNPTLTKCTFSGNGAEDGGGMFNVDSSCPILTNCVFIENSASNSGGGMGNDQVNVRPILKNCLFSGNSAVNMGGGIYNDDCGQILTNCTFVGNSARYNGGISNDENNMVMTNCIFWGNWDNYGMDESAQFDEGDEVIINYSCVQGWTGRFGGVGNFGADPQLVDPNGGDWHLGPGSPCIDAGDNTAVPPSVLTDLDGRPRIIGDTVDMGAYEFWGPIYVDDDGPSDPGRGDPSISDPLENGTEGHPFDTIQEGINVAKNGYTVLIRTGSYLEPASGNSIDFLGKNITLASTDPTDWDIVDNTVIRGYVQFSGTEGPNCKFAGFRIHDLQYGAIYGNHTHATISHCNISGNGACGVTVIKDCDGIISNCLITDNITVALCGIYPVVFGCNGLIKNCTIANNESGLSVGTATIENCIIYNNIGSQLAVTNGNTADISYSNIQNGLAGIAGDGQVNWGPGNIDTDPCFVRSGYWEDGSLKLVEGDYHLKSEGHYWSKSWTYDDYVTSRCIDAGNPGSPLRGELMSVPRDPDNVWGINIRINMGAYGGTSQASMPPHGWTLLADLDNNGIVNFMDFAYQAQGWLMTAPEQSGDLNRDGVLNMMDLAALAENWLQVTDWIEW